MNTKCRGWGIARKPKKYNSGGSVKPNSAQKAFGPTVIQKAERERMAQLEDPLPPQPPEFLAPPAKRRAVDPKTKAKQDAQLRSMLKKHDAALD